MQGEQEPIAPGEEGVLNDLFGGNMSIRAALNELRMRLLDLTGRNKLINFKHTAGKSLQFVHTNLDAVLSRLTAESASKANKTSKVTIAPVPEPDRRDWETVNGRLVRPGAKEHAVRLGVDPSYELLRSRGGQLSAAASGSQARTLFYADDLGKHCRKLERDAKLAIEETGANMLYLVMGFLEFPEAPGSDKLYRAPLVCVPVMMTKNDEGQYTTFHLQYTGEEFAENLSLREKVKRDFGLSLPEFDPDSGTTVEAYFEAITDATASLPNWRVRRMMTLTLLSFSNMLLVRDLDPDSWNDGKGHSALLEHPVVKQVFEGRPASGEAQYAPEFEIDKHPKAALPLIYDADSSQHSALIDVLEGKSRVIEGPPGTGKSQTITNLIAAALQSGKKILFVAEKLAALEVVKSRLTQAGLDQFVLELHSNKTNKKRVLEDLAERHDMTVEAPRDLPSLIQRLEQKRQELQTYSDLMRSPAAGESDLKLQQVMWRAERHRLEAGNSATAVSALQYPSALRTSAAEFASITDNLRYLGEQLVQIETYGASHPMWGFFPAEFRPQDDDAVRDLLLHYFGKFKAFAQSAAGAASFLGGSNINMPAQSADQLVTLLSNISPDRQDELLFDVLPALFSDSDSSGKNSLAVLNDLATRQVQLHELERELSQCLLQSEAVGPDVPELARKAEADLTVLGLTGLTYAQLLQRANVVESAGKAAHEAIELVRGIAMLIGIPADVGDTSIQRAQNAYLPLIAAPLDVVHLRHEGLRRPGAVKVLESSREELLAIESYQAELDAKFYTDALPDDADLRAAIATLREGDAWYRFAQGRWRKANKMHNSLLRRKEKVNSSQRLDDLESLLKQRTRRNQWLADPELIRVAGPHFLKEKTPLKDLALCAKWVEDSSLALERLEVAPSQLDPLAIDRLILLKLLNQQTAYDCARKEIAGFSGLADRLMSVKDTAVLQRWSAPDWQARFSVLTESISTIRSAAELLKRFVKEHILAAAGLKALQRSLDVATLRDGLTNHTEGASLLGARFAGRLTDTSKLLATHAYGQQIKSAKLPAKIEQVLISDRCVENHLALSGYVEAINAGWRDVADFSQAMEKFGAFDVARWANKTGGSTSEFAQHLAQKTELAASKSDLLMPWVQYVGARKRLVSAGLTDFVEKLENGSVAPNALRDAFAYRFYASLAQVAFDKHPELRQFSGLRHTALRQEFADLDKQIISLRGRQVASECFQNARPPSGTNGARVSEKTEMSLLQHLFSLQRPGVTVRGMLKRAGKAVQELKPCFMMGPQAVAQFLEPGRLHFDIVVMDEASQLRPEEAIGAIARGTQLVVVGDPKQLPPTSFFARANSGDSDDDEMGHLATSDAESILDVCKSHFQPIRTLRWHYRSRHESLIAFSNHHFYRGELLVFPSPYPKSKALGVRYHYVADGVYENNMNQVEARRIVEAVVDHIVHRPDDSLGIVTLNAKQKELVSEILEERLRAMPAAIEFKERWEREGMGLFIKNLENVQGDERDCILISTTFGRPKGINVVRQNFGPISRAGGWRRLNVLFTRARKSVAVFSSMRPEDIVSDASTPEGTRALRNYLEFARTGVMPLERETNLPPDSDFEVSVIDVLRSKGYEVTPQLGVAGFRIDIGVKHPDHRSGYLAAIECDGASYHSGRSVRDRDRIRQEILEGLGWKGRIWRIWSTDWFRNPLAETARLVAFLEELRRKPLPAEYLDAVDTDFSDNVHSVPPTVENTSMETMVSEVDQRSIFDDGDEMVVDVGDLVGYASVEKPEDTIHVRITSRQTDPASGLVAESTPLGETLMGASVGETVVLRVPGKPAQSYTVQSIKRKAAEV